MTLSPKLGIVGISSLWHFRLPLPIQMFIKVASSPRLSGIGMPSPILWSHPLKMQRIVLLSSLLWWELGTNSLITGPGEWLSFRRFTSKLSWSWSWVFRVSPEFKVALNCFWAYRYPQNTEKLKVLRTFVTHINCLQSVQDLLNCISSSFNTPPFNMFSFWD